MRKEALLNRLNGIGVSLKETEGALLLLGLGSVGVELDRLDEYSDLDFFVIVKPDYKARFIEKLDWLERVHPLAYSFKNTKDGHKVLFEDGIYGEFAVFEEKEMEHISYTPGRIVWNHPSFENTGVATPVFQNVNPPQGSIDYGHNEALTNLYVGLSRYARGEKLSAMKFIQSHAIDSVLSVLHLCEKEVDYFPDVFGNERRVEKRFPRFAETIGDMMQGYHRVPESAICVLNYLEKIYPVNQQMSEEIRRLAVHCQQMRGNE